MTGVSGILFMTLLEAAISTDLVQLIMECITNAQMNVVWEGETTEDFTPSRGIRQGDHISPNIFVLCIERVSHGIRRNKYGKLETSAPCTKRDPSYPFVFC